VSGGSDVTQARDEQRPADAPRPARPARPARPTVRQHIDRLVDLGSFVQAGRSDGAAGGHQGGADQSGQTGGEALIDGRPVTVGFAGHFVERALNRRHPYIAISSGTGGVARGGPRGLGILDPIWGMSGGPMYPEMISRLRGVPVVSAVVHHSFGDSTFFTGLSDYVVQLRGTCLALTGPRVLAVGTSERVTMEELGGADVHSRNGQADTIAETLDQVYTSIRRFLSFLPTHGGAPLPVTAPGSPSFASSTGSASSAGIDGVASGAASARSSGGDGGEDLGRRRAGSAAGYDMRRLIAGLCDGDSFFELRRDFAPSLITGLARLGGIPVGLVANEPAVDEGAYSADACLKATRLVCLCDAFGLPLIFLVDSPAPRAERTERVAAISRAMMVAQAVGLAEVPKCWVVTGQAMGPGLLVTGSARVATDLMVAWPDARAGFSAGEFTAGAEEWSPDGVIRPDQTRGALVAHLRAVLGRSPVSRPGPLRTWPVGF
jgi:acetyl-CoA carboxylase carboxyltransferase component